MSGLRRCHSTTTTLTAESEYAILGVLTVFSRQMGQYLVILHANLRTTPATKL